LANPNPPINANPTYQPKISGLISPYVNTVTIPVPEIKIYIIEDVAAAT